MKANIAIARLKEKFTSSNNIPVTRAAITLEEFEALESLVDDFFEFAFDVQKNNSKLHN